MTESDIKGNFNMLEFVVKYHDRLLQLKQMWQSASDKASVENNINDEIGDDFKKHQLIDTDSGYLILCYQVNTLKTVAIQSGL